MRKLFLYIVNSTWITQAPVKWKDTDIVAVLKPDKDPTCPSSFRPIALTSSSAKIAEKMVNLWLDNFLESNNIISSDQAGFRKNRGTTDQVAYLAQAVKDSFKRHESTLAVSINLSGAFDTTDRSCAIKQMLKVGVPNNIVRWIHNFINNRFISVVHKGKRSRKCRTKGGVAQGTILCFNKKIQIQYTFHRTTTLKSSTKRRTKHRESQAAQ
jgi:hypothetical protein